jgi:hypothetical protein
MSELTLSQNVARKSSAYTRALIWILTAAWFAIVLVLGSNSFFEARPGTPPLALLIAASVPVALFLLSLWLSPSIRELALTADLKYATAVQSWRIGGYSFLILSAYGYLPGYFAWPAGVGDMFIGVTAPFVLQKMRDQGFTKSRTFVTWNVFGILDLVVAVGLGVLGSVLMGNPAQVSPTTIMSQMPLALIPTFFVPVFIVLHLVALIQARRLPIR